ncbi:7-deoxyloganetin glucosyltransferase-like isoform X1 [Neltuma alba]|uniref:7-deoxyloganetin glucosyltransferase-like isoform X1 n=1 Tax=Neltuma alba TaxID=207710 RepID=UPI0010A38519|nr:7-deoxyloganetin glucosyltransferase-like isoform X1 [Prosopis alba]
MGSIAGGGSKPHAVLTPFPAQGHIISVLKLAKLLHLRGFFITFVNTEFNHKRLLRSKGVKILDALPDFQFETIPDGLPPPADENATQDIASLCDSIRKNFFLPFQNLLTRLHRSASNGFIPPVTCLVSDGCMVFTVEAAQARQLPIILYWPASTYSYLALAHFRKLAERGLIPLKDESYLTNGYLEKEIDCIPGMRNIKLKDLPSFVRTTDPNDLILDFLNEVMEKAHKAHAICFNTFDELEGEAVKALFSIYQPPLYSIGPLPSFLNQTPHNNNQLASLNFSLWKEETQCIDWLQHKEPRSVIYVNFGSITVMSPEQLYEFAWGLAYSKKPFLWIIRPNIVNGGSVILSSEFLSETKERGFIANWCEQEKVLNHASIGGFLTHCGWNSMTESICAGVPMACWPFFADQQTNCRYACKEWGIGIEIDNNVKREEVEKLVNELMEGEKGKKMRQKCLEWKKIAEENTQPGGFSFVNLEKVIKDVLLQGS